MEEKRLFQVGQVGQVESWHCGAGIQAERQRLGVTVLGECGVEMRGFDGVTTEGVESGLEDVVLTTESDMEHQ